jgi:flagellar biosynthesis/type III secretory pathway M-ring protein FliF/YscJ
MVLRSVVNGKPGDSGGAAALASPLTLQSDAPTKVADGDSADDPNRPRLRLKKGSSLKDDLQEIVRDDPDAAADILRSWISKAG